MTKKRFSIVVPIYNVEQYLARCLESVYNQSLAEDDYEVICVNDGSTDGSLSIAERYQGKHSNLQIVSQPNAGLSEARNTGIKRATGDYLIFLDSDDTLADNALRAIIDRAESNPDVIIGNLNVVENGISVPSVISSSIVLSLCSGIEAYSSLKASGIYVPNAYIYIVSRKFLLANTLLFEKGIFFEDEVWTPQMLTTARRVVALNVCHYNYIIRENSIMTSAMSPAKVSSLYKGSHILLGYAKDHLIKNPVACGYLVETICLMYAKAKTNERSCSKERYSLSCKDLLTLRLDWTMYCRCLGYVYPSNRFRRFVAKLLYRLVIHQCR